MPRYALALALALSAPPRTSAGHLPIAASATLSLDGAWSAQSSASSIPAAVPGDVISDLASAGVIASPWLDLTWRVEAARWDLDAWVYSTTFATPENWDAAGETLLVFDSVKMAADIALNGVAVGAATSQHLRYEFPVSLRAAGALNNLTVTFPPTVDDVRNDAGRFAGCSGGWDWARAFSCAPQFAARAWR